MTKYAGEYEYLKGMVDSLALRHLKDAERPHRVVSVDGEILYYMGDFDKDMINLEIQFGVVTGVYLG